MQPKFDECYNREESTKQIENIMEHVEGTENLGMYKISNIKNIHESNILGDIPCRTIPGTCVRTLMETHSAQPQRPIASCLPISGFGRADMPILL